MRRLLALFLFTAVTLLSQDTGIIKGMVLTEDGSPLVSAEVMLFHPYHFGFVPHYFTDADGGFVAKVQYGVFTICAGKPQDGYLEAVDACVFGNTPTVGISAQASTQSVVVRVGPKAGILHIERLIDAVTGEVIRNASIRVCRAESAGSIGSSAKPDMLIPSLTKVTIEVYAPGYFLVGSSRVDLQACKLEYSIVSPK